MDALPSGKAATDEQGTQPHFVVGSTMRHVLVMTGTGAAGLIAIFIVDLVSLLYISWLNDPSMTAGVGLATAARLDDAQSRVACAAPGRLDATDRAGGAVQQFARRLQLVRAMQLVERPVRAAVGHDDHLEVLPALGEQ